ncbi:LysR family transcriptional regulator [Novosphingobium mathurense]|uniref:DNA-binding transcriptional regulator, LysR family n=1 Tax=Novosphingobium mathurense TaxID=428990 RepID=A0A1U6I7Z8_9SPHN|nr:LysR family transcriptional regulator [Novosphingobium mathurense]SLK04112.1 DNA-binding transcriptional regulator, LysR family [Novosphingobium mathurense]
MRLDNFDLNLLIAMEALLKERSVTRAAARLNITQSAMSAALKRLRHAFHDELFIMHGKKMIATPKALEIGPKVSAAIRDLRVLISSGAGFDPATSQRRFLIAASDYITTILMAPLLEVLENEAPGLRIDIVLPDSYASERLANGDIDLMIAPEPFLNPDHPRELLFVERYVVVGWSENPVMQKPLSMETWLESRHVAVQISGSGAFIETAMQELGIERRVEVRVPSFIQAPWLLPGTQHLALMHERLAHLMAPRLSLVIAESPIALPSMRQMIQFHATRTNDEGLSWLRGKLAELAAAGSVKPSV